MDDLGLLIDLHLRNDRQGPGGDEETRRALELARLDPAAPLRIADLGCGTGASTLWLAQASGTRVTAIDMLPEFIERLDRRAEDAGLSERIDARAGPMDSPPFNEGELDLIWSEAAIYNIGFAQGVRAWRPLLRPGGSLVVSELTWTTERRPDAIDAHWNAEYPGITTASENVRTLEAEGYAPSGFFFLPAACWLDNYYAPLEAGFDAFLDRHHHSNAAQKMVADHREEIGIYREFGDWFGYAFYIARTLETA